MTGEITLLGRVLPIGGLKEKTMAAYRSGIKTVIIPADNVSDLEEIDNTVKESIQFKPVDKIDQVLEIALTEKPSPQKTSDAADTSENVPLSTVNQMEHSNTGATTFPQ
jgi:ATP-dependent Lon protease